MTGCGNLREGPNGLVDSCHRFAELGLGDQIMRHTDAPDQLTVSATSNAEHTKAHRTRSGSAIGTANLATDPILTGMAMASAANPIAEDDSLLASRHYEDIPNLQAPYPSQLIYVE